MLHAAALPCAATRALDENGPVDRPFVPPPGDALDRAIHDQLRETAARHPDAPAVQDADIRLTYRDLLAACAHLAPDIAAAAAPGEAVAILLPNSAAFAVAVLACLAAGRPYVALDRRYPAQRNLDILDEARPGALICWSSDRDLLPAALPMRWIDIAGAFRAGPPAEARLPAAALDAPASILFTSGSTGRPKGIASSQRALLHRAAQHRLAFHLGPDDRVLLIHSLCTVAGTREALAALLSGAGLQFVDPETAGLQRVRQIVREREITFFCTVPALVRVLLDGEAPATFASVRAVRLNGDRVLWSDIALLRRLMPAGCHIQVGYSATETPGAQWFVPPGHVDPGPCVPVGHPLPGLTFKLVGADGHAAPPGGEGELVITSPYVALGHWRGGRCIPFPAAAGDARSFATGDIARLLPDGRLDLLGRKDRQIKVRGRRVEPAELEALLRRQPAVGDAAVIPRGGPSETVLAAFVAPRPGMDLPPEGALRQAIREALPSELNPARLHRLDRIPRLPSAKLDAAALARIDAARADRPSGAADEAGTPAAAAIRRAWTRVLGRRAYAWDRSIEEAGGHSLLMLRLVHELERTLGRPIPLDRIRGDMTPADLGALLADLGVQPGPPAPGGGAGLGGVPRRLASAGHALLGAARRALRGVPSLGQRATARDARVPPAP